MYNTETQLYNIINTVAWNAFSTYSLLSMRHWEPNLIDYHGKAKKYIYMCVFQVSRPYLGFCPDPKHFIVNFKENLVKYAEPEDQWSCKRSSDT